MLKNGKWLYEQDGGKRIRHPFVIHKGEWKEKLSEEIREFVEKMNK